MQTCMRLMIAVFSLAVLTLSFQAVAGGPLKIQNTARSVDFNGDTKADLLLRNRVTGKWYMYVLDGRTILSQSFVPITSNLDWVPIAQAKFSAGDANTDVLLRNLNTGAWYLYLMQGTAVYDEGFSPQLPRDKGWAAGTVADVGGDGLADVLLWRTINGIRQHYLVQNGPDGFLPLLSFGITRLPSLVGDFNGDGTVDFGLWSDECEANDPTCPALKYRLNLTSGPEVIGRGMLDIPGWFENGYVPRSTSDFSGDGKADVLIQQQFNPETSLKRWYMAIFDGYARSPDSGFVSMTGNALWRPISYADFNGDGRTDVLMRHQVTGRWYMYLLNGRNVLEENFLPVTPNMDWSQVFVRDFDGDGKADLLLRNYLTGKWYMVLLNGPVIKTQGFMPMTDNLDWEIQYRFQTTWDYP